MDKPVLTIRNLLVKRGEYFSLTINHLDVHNGEVLAIIGPNGAGKSTILLTMHKLLQPENGSITFKNQEIAEINDLIYRRQLALVLQEPQLLDTSVYQNIATGLRFRGVSKSEIEQRINEWASRLDIVPLLEHPASQLSGGQAQRVSLARALVLEPDILLLDEPFSSLDKPSRGLLIQDLRDLLTETRITTIFITHDQEQTLFLADRVAVLLEGRIRQIGTPQKVFSTPIDTSVAEFVGVENVLPGQVIDSGSGKVIVEVGDNHLEATGTLNPGKEVLFCVRPEEITLWTSSTIPSSSARNQIEGQVRSITTHGSLLQITLDCGFRLVVFITRASASEMNILEGMLISAAFKASAVHLIPR
jgi:tungstate transport system ATP-binding protein